MEILKYNAFLDQDMITEEGKMANLAAAMLMGISSIFGVANAQELPKNVKEIITQTTKDPVKAHHLELTGWQLTATSVDTVWSQLPGDTIIKQISVTLGEESFFQSGAYELSSDQKSSIDSILNEIIKDRGVLSSVKVSSSTDKQGVSQNLSNQLQKDGFSGDNQGLSQARAKTLISYLNTSGIDSSLFAKTDVKSNQGEEGKIDQSKRYVTVSCIYACCSKQATTSPKMDTETTYTYQKKVFKRSDISTKKGTSIKKKKCGKKENFSKRVDVEKCYLGGWGG